MGNSTAQANPLPKRHLARSFRPVDFESGALSTLSGTAADRLATNLEISGSYTPVVFSYRMEQSAPGMVLVGCAASYMSLLEHGVCALCDQDECDAYLRVVREATDQLMPSLPDVRNYSSWAHRYYSMLVIRVISRESFTPPLSTCQGGNQGDAFTALHYQTPSHILTLAFDVDWSVSLPLRLLGHSVSLLATLLVYSDDRHFIGPSVSHVLALADAIREVEQGVSCTWTSWSISCCSFPTMVSSSSAA